MKSAILIVLVSIQSLSFDNQHKLWLPCEDLQRYAEPVWNFIRTHLKNPASFLEDPSEVGAFADDKMVDVSTKKYFQDQFKQSNQRFDELVSKKDGKSEAVAMPLKMTCENYGIKFSIPQADLRSTQCIRRIDEKDEVDCNAADQKANLLLERTVMDVKCRLKIGSKLAGSGWTEVYGQKLEDLARFECQTSFRGLPLDQTSQSKVPLEMDEEVDEPVKASLKLMNIGSQFYLQDTYVGTQEIFKKENIVPPNPAKIAGAKKNSASLHTLLALDMQGMMRKLLDKEMSSFLDESFVVFRSTLAIPQLWTFQGCLRALKMIPQTETAEGGILVAFAQTMEGMPGGGVLDCRNNSYI